MSDEQRVRVTMDQRGVAEVALVRVSKMNAIDAAMFTAIVAAIDQLHEDSQVRAVVLHGEGRAFCAGLDMDASRTCAGALEFLKKLETGGPFFVSRVGKLEANTPMVVWAKWMLDTSDGIRVHSRAKNESSSAAGLCDAVRVVTDSTPARLGHDQMSQGISHAIGQQVGAEPEIIC